MTVRKIYRVWSNTPRSVVAIKMARPISRNRFFPKQSLSENDLRRCLNWWAVLSSNLWPADENSKGSQLLQQKVRCGSF